MIDLRMKPEVHKQYDYNLDLNERDDGDVLGDASMNDYLKGYQIEPYAFQQWAKKKNINLKKVAGQEMINMHFYPEFLADYILTLWNGTDGELQDFYEAFTLRYDNKLKKDVAKEIAKLGYKVYPVLVDDRAFYASKKRFEKVMKKASKKDIHTKMNLAKKLFQNSEALKLCMGEVNDIEEMGQQVSSRRVSDLLGYYNEIFPEDYALSLTKNLVDDKLTDNSFEHYQDFGISDESLKNIERMMDGNQDPYDGQMYNGGNTSSTDMGYDYIADMRGFDGVKPELYEAPVVHAKKKD